MQHIQTVTPSEVPSPSNQSLGKSARVVAAAAAVSLGIFGIGGPIAHYKARLAGYFDPTPVPPSAPITTAGSFYMATGDDRYKDEWPKNGIVNGESLFSKFEAIPDQSDREMALYETQVIFPRENLAEAFKGFFAAQAGSKQIYLPSHLRYVASGKGEHVFTSREGLVDLEQALGRHPEALQHYHEGKFSLIVRAVAPQEFPSVRGGRCHCGWRQHENNLGKALRDYVRSLPPNEIVVGEYPGPGSPQLAAIFHPEKGDQWVLVTFRSE